MGIKNSENDQEKNKPLLESDNKFHSYIENAPDGVFVADENGRYLEVNNASERITGYTKAELLSMSLNQLFPPEGLEEGIRHFTKVRNTGKASGELLFLHKNGSKRWWSVDAIKLSETRYLGFTKDITERKKTEEALILSEATVKNKLKAITEPDGDISVLELSDIIDSEALQDIMEDFYNLTGMLGAVLDVSGKVLVAVGWQDICTKFHRCNPDTLKNCIESDTILTKGVAEGTFKSYRCKNNLWDIVTPIMVGGKHVGNVFMGQYFLEGEVPDIEQFREQARKYSFDEEEYLAALDRVPRFSQETVDRGMRFYSKLAGIISKLSFSAIQQSRMLAERKQTEEKLRESENRYRLLHESSGAAVGYYTTEGIIISFNTAASKNMNGQPEDFIGKSIFDIFPMDAAKIYLDRITKSANSLSPQEYEDKIDLPSETKWFQSIFSRIQDYNKVIGVQIVSIDITDRKKAEEKLRQSEVLLKSSLESSKDIIMLSIDKDYNYLYFNQIHIETMSYLYNTVPKLGESMLEIVTNKKDIIDIRKNFEKAFAGESHKTIQEFGEDHGRSYFETKYNPIYVDDEIIGASLFSSNITERIHVEEALQKSEEKYRLLYTAMDQGLAFHEIITDENGKPVDYVFLDINDSYTRLLGVTREMSIGKRIREVMPNVEQYWIDIFGKVALTGESSYYENYLETTGKYYSTYSYCPKKNHFAVLVTDITESKLAKEAIAAEKERLAVTLRSIGDGVITTDTKGNIVMINKVAEALTGWSSNEAFGHPLPEVFNIINENTRERCENPVEKVLATGSIIELENHTCLIAKDGREFVIADSGAPIRNKESQIIGVVLVFRDMTEKQKLEDAFQNSQKLESLGILAGGIAHDFNNILGAIFGYTELAMLETKVDKVSSYLAKSISNIDRARALTEQLLTFAKGGSPIKNVENLFPFVQETTQFALSGSSVSSRFEIQENLWACDFDRNKIGQVIDNLTINAQQAMPMGGTILVSAINISLSENEHITLPGGNYVKLSIKDQGIGIPKEFLTNIFDPYYTTKPNGHGLGLATCFSIISRHDGCIEVESEPGKGSTFHIYLPATTDPVVAKAGKSIEMHNGSGTFLVMDDEETNREIIKALLEAFGYTVVLKENGKDAVDFVEIETKANRKLAGMIFDLTIPGGTGGKEAIGEIRKMSSETPAFVASGYSADPVMANPEEYGFNASICKPFMMDELSEMLEKHMKNV